MRETQLTEKDSQPFVAVLAFEAHGMRQLCTTIRNQRDFNGSRDVIPLSHIVKGAKGIIGQAPIPGTKELLIETQSRFTSRKHLKRVLGHPCVTNNQPDGANQGVSRAKVEQSETFHCAPGVISVLTEQNNAACAPEHDETALLKRLPIHLFLPFLPTPGVLGGSQGVGTLSLGGAA